MHGPQHQRPHTDHHVKLLSHHANGQLGPRDCLRNTHKERFAEPPPCGLMAPTADDWVVPEAGRLRLSCARKMSAMCESDKVDAHVYPAIRKEHRVGY